MSNFLFGYDFYYQYAAGQVLHQQGNPYDVESLNQQLLLLGWPENEVAQGLTHPPSNLWLYWIMALLPFRAALLTSVIASIVINVLCGYFLINALSKDRKVGFLSVLFFALVFPPIISNAIWGQVNAILMLGLTGYLIAKNYLRFFLAGLCLSLILFKPQLFLPFLAIIVVYGIQEKNLRLLLGLAVGFLFQMGFSLLISPNSISWYMTYVPAILAESSTICGATPGQLLECKFGWKWIRPLFIIVGVLLGFGMIKRFGFSSNNNFKLILPLSVLFAPYAWNHTFVVLYPSYHAALTWLSNYLSKRTVVYGAAIFAAVCLPVMVNSSIQYPWILGPLLLLFINIRSLHRPT